jgi:hypothetical protein
MRNATVLLAILSITLLVGCTTTGGIAGRVFSDQNNDGMYDAGDKPISGVTVYAVSDDGVFYKTITDSGGVFTFPVSSPLCEIRLHPAFFPGLDCAVITRQANPNEADRTFDFAIPASGYMPSASRW